MPRIRKKTSNRGSTNERKKILHKVRESRRKTAKAAKKNPQWKSKHKKDPGIPNDFPYKDQILAEVAEERRKAAEEKQRRKDEKKAAKEKGDAASEDDLENEVGEDADAEGSEHGFDGIQNLHKKRLIHANAKGKETPVVEEDEDEVPILINRDLPNLMAVLEQADVIIQVLDARDPLPFRSSHLEELAAAKDSQRIVLVLNKIDTCPREIVSSWAAHLRTQHPTFLFRSASSLLPTGPEHVIKGKGKAKEVYDDGVGIDQILMFLAQLAREKESDEPLAVAVVGLTNAGKSSFINTLLHKPALPIYSLTSSSRGPTTTTLPQEVTIEAGGSPIRLIDTPGLSWHTTEDAEDIGLIRARDILLRSKGRIDRLKDPAAAVAQISSRSNTEDLMLFYNLSAFAKGDPNAFLSGVARSHQLIKKRGELDLAGASRIVLRDWSTGKFPRYTTPPLTGPSQSTTATMITELHANDESILSTLKPRKEMRKSGGLVRLISGEIESRKATIEVPWDGLERDREDEEGSEDEDGAEGDVLQNEEDQSDGEESVADDGSEDTGDEDDEDEEPLPPPVSGKQKRKAGKPLPPARPVKKVVFASDPKETKQARTAGSLKGKKPQSAKPLITAKSKPEKTAKVKPLKIDKKKSAVANVPVKSKIQKVKASENKGEEAYDFGKFF